MLHKINLFQALFEREALPPGLPELWVNGLPAEASGSQDREVAGKSYSLRLATPYFRWAATPKGYGFKRVPQYNWGYSIALEGYSKVDDYLVAQFKSKNRSIIKRYIQRLEACFPISYRYFHGEISQTQYDLVFNALEEMIKDRFQQRQETHLEFWRWEHLREHTLGLIRSGKASFFVIYDGERPIEISLNYHLNKVLFSTISSFAIDYAKFGLGHVEIYKQLEWCLENGFTRFEMGVGGMEYKRRWSNDIYRFEHWILISQRNWVANLGGTAAYWGVRLKEYLKSKKLNEFRDRVASGLFAKKTAEVAPRTMAYTMEILEGPMEPSQWIQIGLQEVHNLTDLNKALNDYLYGQVLPREKVRVFRSVTCQDRYLFKVGDQETWIHLYRS